MLLTIEPLATEWTVLHAAGLLMLALGFLYIVKSCADCRCVGGKKYVRRTKREEEKSVQPDEENPELSPPSGSAGHRR